MHCCRNVLEYYDIFIVESFSVEAEWDILQWNIHRIFHEYSMNIHGIITEYDERPGSSKKKT